MKIVLLTGLVIAVLAGGCATASRTYGPDGSQAFAIDCSGVSVNWGMCNDKAGKLCGTRGYEVINQSGDQGPVINRSLLIKCKP